MTAMQYFELGEDPPGVRLELVNGEVEMSPSPAPGHSHTVRAICRWIEDVLPAADPGGYVLLDTDTTLDEHNVRRPDVLYFRSERMYAVTRERLLEPPDLAVEVVSPSSGTTDRKRKFTQYADAGIAFYWLIDPQRQTFEGYRLDGDRYVATVEGKGSYTVSPPPPFPGEALPLKSLWWKLA